MDITQYESIDFRRIPLTIAVPVWECGKCGGLTTSTITHQSWHDQLNKTMTVILNFLGLDINGEHVMVKDKETLQRAGALTTF